MNSLSVARGVRPAQIHKDNDAFGSPLAMRIERHSGSNPQHMNVIRELEAAGKFLRRGHVVSERGAPISGAYIVKSGWVAARVVGPSRKPAITRLYLPGDLVNLSEMGFATAPLTITMISDGTLSFVSRDRLGMIQRDFPDLYATLIHLDQRDHVATQEQLYAVSRLSAEQRLKRFFLTLHGRVNRSAERPMDRFPFYLQKVQIGDMNGLSAVTISLELSKMHRQKALTLNNKMLAIHAYDQWAGELAGMTLSADDGQKPAAAAE